jgi:hypothetical protein
MSSGAVAEVRAAAVAEADILQMCPFQKKDRLLAVLSDQLFFFFVDTA